MFTFNVDLGQLIIASLIGIVGWFVKKTIDGLTGRLNLHDKMLFDMNGALREIKGMLGSRSTDHQAPRERANE